MSEELINKVKNDDQLDQQDISQISNLTNLELGLLVLLIN